MTDQARALDQGRAQGRDRDRDRDRDQNQPSPRRVTVADPELFPAQDNLRHRPKWYIRIRGFLSLGLLVVTGAVALAVLIGTILLLVAIVSVAFLT